MIGIGFLCHAENDNVNVMARQLARGFIDMGAEFHLVDTRQPDAGQKLLTLLAQFQERVFLCCFNNIGLPTEKNSPIIRILNQLGTPVFSWYLDHPIINAADFAIPLRRHIIAQTSPAHIEFMMRFALHGEKPLLMLPHAASGEAAFIPMKDKDIRCLFVGTYGSDPTAARNRWPEQYGRDVAEYLNRAIEIYDSGAEGGLDHFISSALGSDPSDWQTARSYCILLDRFLRDRLKLRLAQLCVDAGGLVAGPGFEPHVERARAGQLIGAVPAQQVMELIRRSRTVMSGQPEYYQSHERSFTAAAHSAAVVTGHQTCPGLWLDDGVVAIDYRQPSKTPETLAAALADAPLLEEKGRAGFLAIEDRHHYRHRAADILAAVKEARKRAI